MTRLDMNSFYHFGFFVRHSKDYNEVQKISDKEKLNCFLEKKINKLIIHCHENVPYYKELLKEVDFSKMDSFQCCINKLPLLKKDLIRNNFNNISSSDLEKRNYYFNSSGGSTGEPLKIIQDTNYSKWSNIAIYYYYKNIIGIEEPTEKKIMLWGSERDFIAGKTSLNKRILNRIHKTKFLNSFMMTEDDMARYIREINNYKPNFIRGYAGSLYEICKFAEKKHMEVHSPKVIVSSAETLNGDMRNQIESVFGTKVYDFYGSREVNCLAGECSQGNLHVLNFMNHFEVLDKNDKSVKNGEEGRFVVTNLHNYAMPLIRYEIGDTVILGPKKCKCGNILPTLKKVTGRIIDHFILKNGTTVPAEFFIHMVGVVYNEGNIKKFQVVQEDFDDIKILIVLNGKMNSKNIENIENSFRSVMGQNCRISWEYFEDIPKTKSGKYIYTKSKII